MSDTRGLESLERGIETAKAGNKLLARLHLLQAVELAPRDPNCWLWLAWVAESPASAMHSLQRVLDDNPRHELALLGLRWAKAMAEFDLHAQPAVSQEPEATFEPQESKTESDRAAETSESKSGGVEAEPHHGEHNEYEQNRRADGVWSQTHSEAESTPARESRSEEEHGYPQGAVSTRRDDMENWVVLEREEPASEPAERLDWLEEDQPDKKRSAEESNSTKNENRSFAPESKTGGESRGEDRPAETNSSDETVEAPTWWQQSEPSREEEKAEAAEETVAQVKPQYEAHEAVPTSASESPAQESSGDQDEVLVEAEQGSDQGVSVLVVDDSPTVRKLVTMTLEKNGFTVASAPDGVVALKSIAELKPRLILLDITMPRLGGYQLCKLIKKHESTRHIPVIMLSGKDGMFDKVRGKFVGCDDYITKPFDPDVLVEKVSTQLTVAGARS
jgi:twitching motility two-component system response regulator PilG